MTRFVTAVATPPPPYCNNRVDGENGPVPLAQVLLNCILITLLLLASSDSYHYSAILHVQI